MQGKKAPNRKHDPNLTPECSVGLIFGLTISFRSGPNRGLKHSSLEMKLSLNFLVFYIILAEGPGVARGKKN